MNRRQIKNRKLLITINGAAIHLAACGCVPLTEIVIITIRLCQIRVKLYRSEENGFPITEGHRLGRNARKIDAPPSPNSVHFRLTEAEPYDDGENLCFWG